MTQSGWTPLLHVEPSSGRYYIRYKFSQEGYEVHLTDLHSIWSEHLDRDEIDRRAVDASCSIDPRENEEQRQILHDHIAEALTSQHGHLKTLMTASTGALALHIRQTLPEPLRDLSWTLNLRRGNSEDFFRHIIGPLIQKCFQSNGDTQKYRQCLADKDHVITRLLDRLESGGTDLTTVFPGISHVKLSRKQSQRSQLGRYVRGLDSVDTMTASKTLLEKSADVETVMQACESLSMVQVESLQRDTGSIVENAPPSTKKEDKRKSPTLASDGDDETENDDDFETMEVKEGGLDEEDSSAANAIAASLTEKEKSASPTVAVKPARRIGLIGGRDPRTTDLPPASEASSELSAQGQNSPEKKAAMPKKGRLGMIGGGKAKSKPDSHSDESDGPFGNAILDAKRPGASERAHGDRHPADSIVEQPSRGRRDPGMPRADKAAAIPHQPRETSEERANRRRDDLKRQLDTNMTAAGKKKRRF